MRKWVFLFLSFLCPLSATEYNPWFSPLWEFQGHFSSLYNRVKTIQSPKASLAAPSNNYSFHSSLGVTPWPYWNTEIELYLSRTSDIPFSYEAAIGTVRYQWLDDIRGDPFALVTGVTLSFPGNRYFHNFNYAYHAEVNAEFHVTAGKEWTCDTDWWMRMWALGGYGIANQGNGWMHGIAALEFQPSCFQYGIFSEARYGFGSNDIIAGQQPFEGYALIDYRTIDVGGFICYQLGCLGTLSILGWYNAYAHNFVEHDWGSAARLLIPFSL